MKTLLKVVIFAVLLAVYPVQGSAQRAWSEAAVIADYDQVQRLYVLKSIENHLAPKAKAMLEDPLNQEDAYRWAMRVIVLHHSALAAISEQSGEPQMAAFYRQRSALFDRMRRGEVRGPAIEAAEREINSRQTAYLEKFIDDAPPASEPSLDALLRQARYLGDKVHGLSTIAASESLGE